MWPTPARPATDDKVRAAVVALVDDLHSAMSTDPAFAESAALAMRAGPIGKA
ncbi:hypothetical protein GCM10020367_68840 [Streptomyces sannanensis]|uniref:Uncharacterized protein n=1 Tax=Streptomyces sannanensis TaxID=285536 RepID=A0ABP6SMZ5_9ACTN